MKKGQKGKRIIKLDKIRQQEKATNKWKDHREKRAHNSSGSSDFSEFQLETEEIKHMQAGNKKTNYWKKLLNQQDQTQDDINLPKVKNKKPSKNHINNQQQKNMENVGPHIISFQKNKDSQKQSNSQTQQQIYQKQKSKGSSYKQDEQLIQEYDKKQFNGKENAKIREKDMQILNRSRRQQREAMLNQKGTVQTKGGISFEVDKVDFVYKQNQKDKETIKRKGKKKKKNGKRLENQYGIVNVIPSSIFSKEEILKRRRQAFQYGEYARRKTFKYY